MQSRFCIKFSGSLCCSTSPGAMDLLRKVEAAARKVGSSGQVLAERLGVKGRYEAVEKEEEEGGGAGAFTIDDEDGDELNMRVSAPIANITCRPAHASWWLRPSPQGEALAAAQPAGAGGAQLDQLDRVAGDVASRRATGARARGAGALYGERRCTSGCAQCAR